MYLYRTGLGQVWVGSKLPPDPANNIIWLRPSDDHRVLWEIRTYNIYKERWEVLTSAALTAEGLLVLIRDLEKDVKSLQELKVVLYDTVQDLTPEQQQIARQNIGAVSLEDLPFDETITRLAIELTINDEKVYSVVTPLETLTEHYRKFLADPTKYVWQLYLKVGEDQLGLVPLFIVTYGGLHIGFYSPDTSGETKYISLDTNGDVVIRATVNNYGPTLVEVVQSTGDSIEKVMSQKTVTEELSKKASVESVTDGISAHNMSSTSHADIRKLLNTCVGLPAYDSSSYKITFTTLAGASVEIDLPIEQLALRYNAETESIEFDNADGTTTSIPVSAFVKEYVGSIGDRIQISIDENNAIHATVLKNSIDWNCLSVELQERINDHVTSSDFATKAVRTDIAQSLSLAAQNQALENIGADLVRIPYSLLGTTLSDEMANVINNARGIILVDTPNNFISPTIYNKGRTTSSSTKFITIGETKDVYYISYNKNTKALANVVHTYTDTGCVRYVQAQNLTTSEQDKALSNIGLDFVHVDYSLLNTTLDDSTAEAVNKAKGIILVNIPENFVGPTVYIKGFNDSSICRFFALENTTVMVCIDYNKSNKKLYSVRQVDLHFDSVRYSVSQNLTDVQKQQARSNINAVGSSMIKGVEIVYGTAPMQEDNILYIELEETT